MVLVTQYYYEGEKFFMNISNDYQNYKETKNHGTPLFPCAVYSTVIPSTLIYYPTHWHSEMEIIFVKAGTGIVNINFMPQLLHNGDVLVIPPGLLHSIEQKDSLSFSYHTVLFDLNMLISDVPDICSMNFILPLIKGKSLLPVKISSESPASDEIGSCLKGLIQCHFKRPLGYELYVKSQLFQFLFLLITHNLLVKDDTSITSTPEMKKLKIVISYIESNYFRSITLEEVSRLLNYSTSHFMKFFKNNTDTSFITYLNNYRLNIASELLLTTNHPILYISELVGFENHSYFIRSFKRKYQLTPAAFRKKFSPD